MSENITNTIPTENTAICEHCGMKVKVDAQFCSSCGKPVIVKTSKIFCQTCGTAIDSDEKFCPKCGSATSQNRDEESLDNIAAYNQTVIGNKKKSKKKTVVLNILIIFFSVILALAAIGYFYVLPEYHYRSACENLDNKLYEQAYLSFVDMGDYSDSQEKINECIYEWADYALSQSTTYQAYRFSEIVELSSTHHPSIYSKIVDKISSNTSFDYWDDTWLSTNNSEIVYAMLQTLPSSYEDCATLNRLFKALYEGDIHPVSSFIRENKSLLKSVWDIAFVQDFLTDDEMMAVFLEGYWTSYDGYYLSFYEDEEDGGTYSNFDLPWVAKPSGTKYYEIKSLTYCWTDSESNVLAKVFKFTVEDYDTITVYCYKNNRTYKLYR